VAAKPAQNGNPATTAPLIQRRPAARFGSSNSKKFLSRNGAIGCRKVTRLTLSLRVVVHRSFGLSLPSHGERGSLPFRPLPGKPRQVVELDPAFAKAETEQFDSEMFESSPNPFRRVAGSDEDRPRRGFAPRSVNQQLPRSLIEFVVP
jgi:hypothetical protein